MGEGKEVSLKPVAELVGTPCATVKIQSSVAVYPVRRLKSEISGVRMHVLVQS